MNTRRRNRLTSSERLNEMLAIHGSFGHSSPEATDEDFETKSEPRKKRARSEIWTLFNFGDTHYFCQLCLVPTPFKRPPSTTVAIRHIRRFHSEHPRVQELMNQSPEFRRLIDNHANSPETTEVGSSTTVDRSRLTSVTSNKAVEQKKPKQIQFENSFVKMLSLPCIPLTTAMSPEMTSLLGILDPKIYVPTTVKEAKELLMNHAEDIRRKIGNEIVDYKSSLSATIGHLTYVPRNWVYISVNVHFIKQNTLQNRFLGLRRLHDDTGIECVYKTILQQYDLTETDVYRVFYSQTSDAVSSLAVEEECDEVDETDESTRPELSLDHNITPQHKNIVPLKEVKLEPDECQEKKNDVGAQPLCVACELKTLFVRVIKRTLLKSSTYKRLLGLFEMFQSSPQSLASLTSSVQAPFVRPVKNKWTSWVSVLEFYVQHHNLMGQIAIHHGWEPLSGVENDRLTKYLEVISVFRSSIRTLDTPGSITVSWIYGILRAINTKLKTGMKSEDEEICSMCKEFESEMNARFSYILDDPIFIISTFLDPATKNHLKQDDAERACELIADDLKIDQGGVTPLIEDANNPADPLLSMLDSFGVPSNDAKASVRSFSDMVCSEFQAQTEKGPYSSTTIPAINAVVDPRFQMAAQLARTVLAVPTSNTVLEDAFRTSAEHLRDPEGQLLNAKLMVHLNKT
ncbi:hypothetical protein M3Y94_01202500 [Aphelenchoides besseyi]|nr:hypothetical protein M3Y94_01202500 [Aphelenchoides besseyi]KAI6228447.1 hypothetical protein M3Y95_00623200 [Aphelenchoides besseyi]